MKTLRILGISGLIALIAGSVVAQPAKSTWLTTSLGITSDWVINQNAYGNQEMEYGTKFGVTPSLGVNHYIDRKYGIGTGIAFINLGQNYQGEQSGAKATRKVNLNYIQVPLMVMRQLCDPQHPCWLSIGPQLMFLTSASQKYTREDGDPLRNPEYLPEGKTDVSKWYKPFDIMLNIGFTNLYSFRKNDMRMSINIAGIDKTTTGI